MRRDSEDPEDAEQDWKDTKRQIVRIGIGALVLAGVFAMATIGSEKADADTVSFNETPASLNLNS